MADTDAPGQVPPSPPSPIVLWAQAEDEAGPDPDAITAAYHALLVKNGYEVPDGG